MIENSSECSAFKGLAAGLVAGLVASFVMSQFQTFVSAVGSALKETEPQGEAGGKQHSESGGEVARQKPPDEPATVKAAEALSMRLLHRKLTNSQKKLAGPMMHYAMGVTTGALYGTLCETEPPVAAGGGLLFGASVWGVADNLVVPALGLSKPPAAYPASTHVYALASHLVYGVTAELVRRIVRRAL